MSDHPITAAERERTARTVSDFCMLPDPRRDGFGTRLWNGVTGIFGFRSINDASEQSCIRRQIDGKAALDDFISPPDGSAAYNWIVARARAWSEVGARNCLVREFNDNGDEPRPYYGYRGGDGQCHVTHDQREALNARRSHPQYR